MIVIGIETETDVGAGADLGIGEGIGTGPETETGTGDTDAADLDPETGTGTNIGGAAAGTAGESIVGAQLLLSYDLVPLDVRAPGQAQEESKKNGRVERVVILSK